MSVYDKANKTLLHFRQRMENMVFGRAEGGTANLDENSDAFEKEAKDTFKNLTEDERQQMIESLLDETNEELEDMWAEMWPGRTLDLLMLRDLLEKAKA